VTVSGGRVNETLLAGLSTPVGIENVRGPSMMVTGAGAAGPPCTCMVTSGGR